MDDSLRLTENMYAIMNADRPTESRQTFKGEIDDTNLNENLTATVLDAEDLDFFEEAIAEALERVQTPIRATHINGDDEDFDPYEELLQVKSQAQDVFENLKRLVDLSQFMLEKNKEISSENRNMQLKVEEKEQLALKAVNGQKVLKDQLKEKAMQVLIEQEKTRDLQQDKSNLQQQLILQQKVNQEFESQLKKEMKRENTRSSVVNDSQFNAIKASELVFKEKVEQLKDQLQKEKEKNKELDELVEKNLILYEHELKKTENLQKELQKEKKDAAHYKKRYTRVQDKYEKCEKVRLNLEDIVKQYEMQISELKRDKMDRDEKVLKQITQTNLNQSLLNTSNLNQSIDFSGSKDNDKSFNTSGYYLGKGRDSVVSKSFKMKNDGNLQSQRLVFAKMQEMGFQSSIDIQKSIATSMKPIVQPEPLVLNFPYPITRKVEMDNYQRKLKQKRRAGSIEVISALRPDLIENIATNNQNFFNAENQDEMRMSINYDAANVDFAIISPQTEYKKPEIVFMLGKNGVPSTMYNQESPPGKAVAKQHYNSPITPIKSLKQTSNANYNEGLDLVQFANCIKMIKSQKRSTSVQYKTAYADDKPSIGLQISVPAKKRFHHNQMLTAESIQMTPNQYIQIQNEGPNDVKLESFIGLDQNASYVRPQQNANEISKYDIIDNSRIEGDILPDMFQDDYPHEYPQLNLSLAQYEKEQLRSSKANQEYGKSRQSNAILDAEFGQLRMSHIRFDELQEENDAQNLKLGSKNPLHYDQLTTTQEELNMKMSLLISKQDHADLIEESFLANNSFLRRESMYQKESSKICTTFGRESQKNYKNRHTITNKEELNLMNLMQSNDSYQFIPQNQSQVSGTSFATKDYSMLTQGHKFNLLQNALQQREDQKTIVNVSVMENNDVQPIPNLSLMFKMKAERGEDFDGSPQIQDCESDSENTFDITKMSKENFIGKGGFDSKDGDELEFDIGKSPDYKKISQNKVDSAERKSLVPQMLNNTEQAQKLAEAYQELNESIIQEMTESFDEHIRRQEEEEMRNKVIQHQQQKLSRQKPQPSIKRRPLELQLVEEMEDEETSANPYGRQISPGAMAGDNYSFTNQLQGSSKKIFSNQLSLKASNLLTPQNEVDKKFFDNLQSRINYGGSTLQTPTSNSSKLIGRSSGSDNKQSEQDPKILSKKGPGFFETVLEKQLEDDAKQSSDSGKLFGRRDPHEEFFKLTLLAFKLNNKVSNSVLITDPTECYNECMKIRIAFYKWPQWIEDYMKRRMWNERHNYQVARLLKIMEIKNETETVLGEDIKLNLNYLI